MQTVSLQKKRLMLVEQLLDNKNFIIEKNHNLRAIDNESRVQENGRQMLMFSLTCCKLNNRMPSAISNSLNRHQYSMI